MVSMIDMATLSHDDAHMVESIQKPILCIAWFPYAAVPIHAGFQVTKQYWNNSVMTSIERTSEVYKLIIDNVKLHIYILYTHVIQ